MTITPINIVRVGVAVVVYNTRNEILWGLRKGDHGGGTWSLPGGHVEYGEDPQTASLRETLEETDLAIEYPERYVPYAWTNTLFDSGKQYITLYFTAFAIGEPKVMEPDKCEKWEWRSLQNLPSPLFEPIGASELLANLEVDPPWRESNLGP